MYAAFSSRHLDPPFARVSMDDNGDVSPDEAVKHLKSFLDAKGIKPKVMLSSDGSALAASAAGTFLEEGSLAIMATGAIRNIPEMAELYNISPVPSNSVELLAAMYEKEFMDVYGDGSDQPATAISSLQGSFAFMLFDSESGYFLAGRSACGLMPFHWGTAEDNEEIVMLSTDDDGLSDFPPGCMFESHGDTTGELVNFTRHTPMRRCVNTMPSVDSHGHLCAVKYTTQSGNDLVSMASPGQESC